MSRIQSLNILVHERQSRLVVEQTTRHSVGLINVLEVYSLLIAYVTRRELFHTLRIQKVVLSNERGRQELNLIDVIIESVLFNCLPDRHYFSIFIL